MGHKYGTNTIPKRLINSLVPFNASPNTWRFNHENCPAGEDTKRRLYITIPADKPHVRLAFCHNCGGSGSIVARADSNVRRCSKFSDRSWADETKLSGPSGPTLSMGGHIQDPDQFPTTAKGILKAAGLTPEMIKKYGICYDYKTDRLVYPYYRTSYLATESKLLSAQYRKINYYDKGPKYFTIQKEKCQDVRTDVLKCAKTESANILVITEDLLSAIRVVEAHNNADAVPLAGTHVKTERLYQWAMQYDSIVIWLDNDSPHIIETAEDMAATLKALGKCRTYRVSGEYEPKHLDDNALIINLDGADYLV